MVPFPVVGFADATAANKGALATSIAPDADAFVAVLNSIAELPDV